MMKQKKTSRNVFLNILLFLLFTFEIFNTGSVAAQKTPVSVRVGVVVEMDVGDMELTCISMALSDFYSTRSHYKTRLVLTHRNSKGDVVTAAAAVVDLLKNVEVQAIIGPEYSSEANFIIALGEKAQVPIITYSATSPFLSSSRSPYFFRATLTDSSQVDAIGAIVRAYGWREVVLIYEGNVFGEGIVPFLSSALENVTARVTYRSVLPSLATDDQIAAELYKLKSMHTRVFIVHMLKDLGSRFFTKAKQLDMMSQDYVWIITDGMAYELSSLDPLVLESMTGVIGVRPYTPKTKELEDFTVRYNAGKQQHNPKALSPELNIFGLWAYDATIALARAVEKAKLGSYHIFPETNISRNSNDIESFVKSPTGPKLIQALSDTSFIGLAGNFTLVEGQLQSPPYEIINVVGPGHRVIGYWTKESGIIRKLKFASPKTNQYSTNKSNFRPIIWPGDKPYPAKGWVIPTNEKKLKVGVPVKNGFAEFVMITWNSDNTTKVDGLCIKIFDEVMKSLPYGVSYEYIPFATSDCKMNGTYNELVQHVSLGSFDAVAGDVTILADRSQDVDFSLPYMESGISMVVPVVHDKRKNGWIFLKPLTWELWVMILGSFVILGILIWVLEHPTNEDFRGTRWYQFGTVFWFAFSTMVFAHKENVITNPAKFVLIVWFMVVLILTQSYTANLTSMLTVQRLHPTVRDVDFLIQNNLYVGYKKGSFIYEFLIRRLKFHQDRLVPFNSPEQMNDLFEKGSGNGGMAAAFHEIPYLKVFLAKYCSKYTMVDPTYRADGFGFVFPKGSPLVADVSRAILNFTEGKTMMEIEDNWLNYHKNCPDSGNSESEGDSLHLASFKGLFIIIGIAASIAFVYYLIKPLFHIETTRRVTDSEKLNRILVLLGGMNNNEDATTKGPTSSSRRKSRELVEHNVEIQDTMVAQSAVEYSKQFKGLVGIHSQRSKKEISLRAREARCRSI